MRIRVKVVPRAKRPGVEQMAGGVWRVAVSAPAEGGKANAAVIEVLAEKMDIPKSSVRIIRGLASRLKEVEINGGTLS